ncbi:bifunctional diguanylate cyclase/phosphodiesterase [Butyrivibrio sp. VCB2006]|uniref:bifunctional diguanylate cyclase/phosphodiesterase n=1 Tax=Butyrivibrio sp. VCB2006 TaxID=1280679 RepID=UPI000420EC4E|nr:GGDEF domain-containing protein [Butyrivibrio sp. VCB2006]
MNITKNMQAEFEQYIVDNLDRAIKEEWIKAYHQPLVRAASGRVSDEEAFAKWEDPERGIISASEFIHILEREKLTYKLDLYMVERVLKKMKGQGEHGLFIVPESVNIGRSDFDCCDMVTEIIKRVDAAGLPREKLSVELSEGTISSDVQFMKTQVERFRSEGIKVWMDDYGSGNSSLLLLLQMHFDLLKIDKTFIDQIEQGKNGRIILTEIIKTALSLGMDTVAEGVETKEQADFLMEVGCTKLQGYYYTKPISLADIIKRNQEGIQIGFENPAESEYFEHLGRVNLYDLSFSKDDDDSLDNYFDTLPMAVFSLDDEKVSFIRCNQSFRSFASENFEGDTIPESVKFTDIKPGVGYYSFNAVRQCSADGKRVIIDDRFDDGRIVQLFIRRVAINPVTKSAAVAVCILSISNSASDENLNYNYIARALSEDYIKLYFVDMDTDKFTEYAANGISRDINLEKHGTDYFNIARNEFDLKMLPEDRKTLEKVFTKENFIKGLENNGTHSIVTKIILDDKPVYASFKAVKVRGEGNHIIIGLCNVDSQIKDREALEKAKEERVIYSRISALTGDFIYIYTVDIETMHFTRFKPMGIESDMGLPEEGDNFFETVIPHIPKGIYHEDVDAFLTAFTQENVLTQIHNTGIFENQHRLMIHGKPVYVMLKATIVNEEDKDYVIFGVIDVDERVKKEQEFEKNLFAAENKANIDELTGIKNKHAYAETERKMNGLIDKDRISDFAIAVFDINGLKEVNDTKGHQAGDEFIRNGCDLICHHFKHSPVFRIGGDEFVAILQGEDFDSREDLVEAFNIQNINHKLSGEVVIAVGVSTFDEDPDVATVFGRADKLMYENKKALKE